GIKNAIRLLRAQKLEPTWDNYVAKFLKDKIKTEDPRKVAEVKAYFEAESAKPVKIKPSPIDKGEQALDENEDERNSVSEDQIGNKSRTESKRDSESKDQCEDKHENVGVDQQYSKVN